MQREDKGQIIVPTGGGKTYIMINDFIAMLQECNEIESDNVTVANQAAVKNAELEYKTQMLNNNEKKQLYIKNKIIIKFFL